MLFYAPILVKYMVDNQFTSLKLHLSYHNHWIIAIYVMWPVMIENTHNFNNVTIQNENVPSAREIKFLVLQASKGVG